MANKHDDPRHICPICLKRFRDRHGLKTHVKAKGHGLFKADPVLAKMQRYHQDKITLENE